MATAKKATTKKTTATPQAQNGQPSDDLVHVSHQEFYNAMSQMYPEQSARVVAEIKNIKLQQLVRELRGDA